MITRDELEQQEMIEQNRNALEKSNEINRLLEALRWRIAYLQIRASSAAQRSSASRFSGR